MPVPPDLPEGPRSFPVWLTLLPGADRKRSQSSYCYRLTYQNPLAGGTGCVMLWEVSGGRLPYQIALERDEAGNLRLHCTCADAVFRAEAEGRFCKHVHGLLQCGRPGSAPQQRNERDYDALGA
ncbi:MAG TPA: hypothetical protein VG013_29525 [Gemmataceae bacterium]|jgi:hypothetical protein|nr:hypothetical protein [Gemmataceae bacterium]